MKAAKPEALFHVGDTIGRSGRAFSTMDTGRWLIGPAGTPAFGALGVLIDDCFGGVVLPERPSGMWAATTEMSIDFCSEPPIDGTPLTAEAEIVQVGPHSGVGRGTIWAPDGRVIAVGTQQLRFINTQVNTDWDSVPDQSPGPSLPIRQLLRTTISDGPDGPIVHLPTGPEVGNPAGTVHGGVTLCVAEIAGLTAAQSSGTAFRTSSIHLVYLRPTPIGETIAFTTQSVHRGRTLAVIRVAALREDGKACTVATVTCHALRGAAPADG